MGTTACERWVADGEGEEEERRRVVGRRGEEIGWELDAMSAI
jgi:hypothetical protein